MLWFRSAICIGILACLFVWLVPTIVWLLSKAASKVTSRLTDGRVAWRTTYKPYAMVAGVAVVIVCTCIFYGSTTGRFESVVNKVVYANKQLPKGFDGYKIVQVSDFHIDSFEDPADLQRIVDEVNAQKPDIILYTGDLLTGDTTYLQRHVAALKSMKAKDGVYSVLGNHDFFIYEYKTDEERCAAADRLAAFEKTVGWTVLRNDSRFVYRNGDSIAIAGVDNIQGNDGFATIQKGDLKKALKNISNTFTILMTHDPSHWRAEVLPKSDVQVTLSGHTHAAQVRLFGWSLANWKFKESDGRYDEGDRMIYVNAGTGTTAPFRIFCPSEITVITLKSE